MLMGQIACIHIFQIIHTPDKAQEEEEDLFRTSLQFPMFLHLAIYFHHSGEVKVAGNGVKVMAEVWNVVMEIFKGYPSALEKELSAPCQIDRLGSLVCVILMGSVISIGSCAAMTCAYVSESVNNPSNFFGEITVNRKELLKL